MSLTNTAESDFLLLIFNNTAVAKIGDSAGILGSAGAGSLYISLHTADPGETGIQTTSEASYTSYARVAVARSAGGWTISATAPTQAANTATVTFPQCTGGSSVVTHAGIGTDPTGGTGKLLFSGALASSLSISNNITPSFSAGSLIVTLD